MRDKQKLKNFLFWKTNVQIAKTSTAISLQDRMEVGKEKHLWCLTGV